MATTIQEKGYVVVVPSYSTYPTGYLAEMVSDIRAVIMWTQDHIRYGIHTFRKVVICFMVISLIDSGPSRNDRTYGGDPNNVYLMGHSAGSHLA